MPQSDLQRLLKVGLTQLQATAGRGYEVDFDGEKVACTITEVETLPGDLEGTDVHQMAYTIEALKDDFTTPPKQGMRITHPEGWDMEVVKVRPINGITWMLDCLRINASNDL